MADAFTVERKTVIAADAAKVYPLIADLHRWEAWSPYEALDPKMTKAYSGADAGVGAVYDWAGNAKAGSGRVTITDATEPSRIGIALDMFKPMKAKHQVDFVLTPVDGGVQVAWIMTGPMSLMGKAMGLFFDMDKMVGGQFEQGLAKLKAVAEA